MAGSAMLKFQVQPPDFPFKDAWFEVRIYLLDAESGEPRCGSDAPLKQAAVPRYSCVYGCACRAKLDTSRGFADADAILSARAQGCSLHCARRGTSLRPQNHLLVRKQEARDSWQILRKRDGVLAILAERAREPSFSLSLSLSLSARIDGAAAAACV